jgi:hypothetical protein
MPIYSRSDTDAVRVRDTHLSAAGVTSSLAATAAALLADDPGRELPPRLRGALARMRELVSDLSAFSEDQLGLLFEPNIDNRVDPEQLVARLMSSPPNNRQKAGELVGALQSLSQDFDRLLQSPTEDAARRVEQFLGSLSRAETAQSQASSGETVQEGRFVSIK